MDCPQPTLRIAHLIALASLTILFATPLRALAEPEVDPPKDPDEAIAEGAPRPSPPDTRTAHLIIDPKVGLLVPTGNLAGNRITANVVGLGVSYGGIVGVGISRYVAFEGSGNYAMFSGPSTCRTCSGQSIDVGFAFSYHVAQGLAVDPWVSLGAGYRDATYFTAQNPGPAPDLIKETYRGIDFARIALGADFYPLSVLGVGPYIEADIGTNVSRPVGVRGLGTYAFVQFGIRIALDPLRSRLPRAHTSAHR